MIYQIFHKFVFYQFIFINKRNRKLFNKMNHYFYREFTKIHFQAKITK